MIDPTRHLDAELSEYLDGGLSAEDRSRVEEHLGRCESCATLLEELRSVVERARDVVDVAPEADLWPGIARRLESPTRVVRLPDTSLAGRRLSFSVPQLAAAGLLIAVLSAGGAWWAMRAGLGGRAVEGAAGVTALESATAPDTGTSAPVSAALARLEDGSYDQAIASLEQDLAEHSDRLDPRTVAVVKANLAAIDAAILKARRALEADPSNPYLNNHLAEQMKRKVRVLQSATEAVAANVVGS